MRINIWDLKLRFHIILKENDQRTKYFVSSIFPFIDQMHQISQQSEKLSESVLKAQLQLFHLKLYPYRDAVMIIVELIKQNIKTLSLVLIDDILNAGS